MKEKKVKRANTEATEVTETAEKQTDKKDKKEKKVRTAKSEPAADAAPSEEKEKRVRKRKRVAKSAAAQEPEEAPSPKKVSVAPSGGGAEPSTLYVEGISYDASEDDVQSAFEKHGTVLEVRMPRYQDSGKPRGYAHVDFASAGMASAALAGMDGVQMMGRYLKVARANARGAGGARSGGAPRARPAGCKTIFVRNLPYDCSEDAVRQTFSACGKVTEVRIAAHSSTGLKKGFGYVEFVKESSAEVAVNNKEGLIVGGRAVACDYDEGRPKGSFRTASGRNYSKEKTSKAPKKRTAPKL